MYKTDMVLTTMEVIFHYSIEMSNVFSQYNVKSALGKA